MQRSQGTSRSAAIYVRVSTDDQVRGAGLPTQEAECRREVERLGLELVDVFTDDGISGAIDPAERPGFSGLLASEPDVIVAHEASRLSRDLTGFLMFRRQYLNVALLTLDGVNVGPGEEVPLDVIVKVWSSGDERVKIRERTMRGKAHRRENGGWTGGLVPFGFRLVDEQTGETLAHGVRNSGRGSRLERDEAETTTLARMADLLLASDMRGCGDVASVLNVEGLLPREFHPKSGHVPGRKWRSDNVRAVLKGAVERNDETIDVKAVEAELDRTGSARGGGRNAAKCYPLAGRITDATGATLIGWTNHGNKRYRRRGRFIEQKGGIVPAEKIEQKAWAAVCNLLGDRERLLDLIPAPSSKGSSRENEATIEKKIARLAEARGARMADGLKAGIDPAVLKAADDQLAAEVAEMEAHLEKLRSWREREQEAERSRDAILSLADLDGLLVNADLPTQKRVYETMNVTVRLGRNEEAEAEFEGLGYPRVGSDFPYEVRVAGRITPETASAILAGREPGSVFARTQ